MIRKVNAQDIKALTTIYNHYIKHTVYTFETQCIDEIEMKRRVDEIALHYPYFVFEEDNQILGYCYVHPWRERAAYSHTLEVTVYLSPQATGRGLGRTLSKYLIDSCRSLPCKALIACITADNTASCTLFTKLGFQKVSHFKQVGYKMGRWLDVVDYELLLPTD